MARVNHYLLKNFMEVFSTLFFILFFVASIIFFINIANVTSVIKMNFIELFTMYVYLIPKLLIYTIPITFFVALCLTLFNLSKENELIILFSLGYSPKRMSRFFTTLAFLFSLLLVVNIVVLVPLSNQLNNNFLEYKKAKAKFNIQESKFGQKFSDWLVYISKAKKNQSYEDIALYKVGTNTEATRLILSQQASIKNEEGSLRLILNDGKAFEFHKDKIQQINFKKMHMNSTPNEDIGYMQTIYTYWTLAFKDKKRAYDFAFFMLIALFPLSTVWLAMGISVVVSRYASAKIYWYQFLSILIYFSLAVIVAKINPFGAIFAIFLVSLIASYAIYKRNVLSRF
ncbi:LptF/LptG family permease [Sulfurospirillum sp. 1612]|uniref:LptF/LptG family permease n=1 Tax=Sulfurospirillum sp. 1612 TaxID=3094835 RepID=UPI002F9596EB